MTEAARDDFPVLGSEALFGRHVLTNIHSPRLCTGRPCVIHNRTDHHMRSWPLHWRDDRGIFERICGHGVGHPDPDQFEYWRRTGQSSQTIHGCCGQVCCRSVP